MLVLSRQRDESIMIGDDIEVVIVDIRGNKVRLGITAPTEIPVHRKEVYEAIKNEKKTEEKMEEKFNKDILSKARKVVDKYHIIVTQNDELGFVGNSIEFPNVYADDKNMDKCFRETREASIFAIAVIIVDGREPPESTEKYIV